MLKNDLCGVYKITCVANGKCYIGQSKNIRKRWYSHKSLLKKNKHENKYLQRLYNKYGVEQFTYEILELCSIEKLDERERYWIAQNGGVDSIQNCNWESGGHKHKTYSLEQRKLISERYKGKSFSPENQFKKGQAPWNKGKKATPQAIENQRKSHLGKHLSEETKAKLSAFWKGKKFQKLNKGE